MHMHNVIITITFTYIELISLYTKYFLCTYTTYFHQELKIKKKGRNVTVIVTKETTKREK